MTPNGWTRLRIIRSDERGEAAYVGAAERLPSHQSAVAPDSYVVLLNDAGEIPRYRNRETMRLCVSLGDVRRCASSLGRSE